MQRRRGEAVGGSLEASAALAILATAPGERLPTVRELAGHCRASVGATQAVIAAFEEEGFIAVERRGRFGTWLSSRSVGRLLRAAAGRPFVIALPLPSTLRIQGLATGLRSALAAVEVDAFLSFIRGSRQRIAALRARQCDICVMSGLAAHELAGGDTSVALELPPRTFVLEHRVYHLPDEAGSDPRPRVGVDRDSVDFEVLTELEFGSRDPEIVPGSYMRSAASLARRQIGAVILDVEEAFVRLPSFVRDRPLSESTLDRLDGRNTSAAFLVRADDPAATIAVQAALDVERVLGVQAEVIAGDRVAEY